MAPEQPVGIVVTRSVIWATLSAAAIIAGSLGTWVTAGPFSVGGTAGSGDGVVTLVLGVVALVLVVLERARPATAVVAGAALAIGVIDASSVLRVDGNEFFDVTLGWGLVVLPLGAASLLAWSIKELLARDGRTRVALFAGATVAVVITVVVMAASGRFDLDESGAEATDAGPSSVSTAAEATTTDTPETATTTTAQTTNVVGEVGDALTLTGGDDLTMRVTLTRVVDPLPAGEYDSSSAGKRTVGVELRLTNQSASTVYDDSPSNGAALIFGDGEQADATPSFGDCTNPSPRIVPGDSRKICIPFEVDESATLSKFQLQLDSGFSDDGGEWVVRGATGAASSSSATAPSSTSSTDDPATTSCDQNIKAGPATTCGFADDVFREYAAEIQAGSDPSSVSLRAKSPATGKTYSVTCDSVDSVVRCRAADGAFVRFPQRAAEVY